MPPAIENRVQGREKPFFSYKYWSFFFLENGQYHLFAPLLWDSGHGSPEPGLPYMQWGMDNVLGFLGHRNRCRCEGRGKRKKEATKSINCQELMGETDS